MDIIPTYTLVKHDDQWYILDEEHYLDTDPCHPHGWYHVYRWFPILSLDRIGAQAQADLNNPVHRRQSIFTSTSEIPLYLVAKNASPDYYLQQRQDTSGVYEETCFNNRIQRYVAVEYWMEEHIALRKEEVTAVT